MEFRILGSLEAEAATGERLSLAGPSEQKLLAVLLLNAGRTVPLTDLVDALWDEAPPATAVKQVQNVAGRLRRILAQASEPDPIVTRGGGYQFRVGTNSLDTRKFEAKVAKAEAATLAGKIDETARLLRDALELWRGPALSGLRGKFIETAARSWDERRCDAQERYFHACITLGEHRLIIADLQALVSAHPMRERPVGQLMLALYRCGRRAEALALYRDTRRLLADELGIDPGPELWRLHQQILAGGQGRQLEDGQVPDRPAASQNLAVSRDALAGPPTVPRQLPAAPRNFAGRTSELRALATLLDGEPETGGTVLISAISGMAGVGKTALAVYWAHQTAVRFPDGQLYIDLRGFGPSVTPVAPAEALRGFLSALNVPPERIPVSMDERAALYRSLLARRKILVVLDNARDTAQVLSLLPGSSGCLVVVTSRNQLTQLVADGAYPVILGPLKATEARQLLAGRLGEARLAAEPASTGNVIDLCVRLPLALSIVAARAATSPALPLAVLAADLRDARARLDALDAGDDASVRVAFSWSYRRLTGLAAQMFRRLGCHPGSDICRDAAASVADMTGPDAMAALAELTRAHLLNEYASDRFSMHDLLRAYAAERSAEEEHESGRHAALERLSVWYLRCACAARCVLDPFLPPLDPAPGELRVPVMEFGTEQAALSWCDQERANVTAITEAAARAGLHEIAWKLPTAMFPYFDRRKHYGDWITTHQAAIAAASRIGDREAEGKARCNLGSAYRPLRRFGEAIAEYELALSLFRETGWRLGEAKALGNLASCHNEAGDAAGAAALEKAALDVFSELGDDYGQALCQTNLGNAYNAMGQYTQAVTVQQQALDAFQRLDDRRGAARALCGLGVSLVRLGRPGRGLRLLMRAAQEFAELADEHEQARVLLEVATAHKALGQRDAAADATARANEIFTSLGEHWMAAPIELGHP